MGRKPVILGVDPGTTTGITILGVDGKIIYVGSSKDLGLSDAISIIRSKGLPISIGTDKSKVPAMIKSMSSSLGIRVYSPSFDMSTEEKKALYNKHQERIGDSIEYNNSHEYDSICSAIYAYNKSLKLLKKLYDRRDMIPVHRIEEYYKRAFNDDKPLHRIIMEIRNEELQTKTTNDKTHDNNSAKEHKPSGTRKNVNKSKLEEDNIIIGKLLGEISDREDKIISYEKKISLLRYRIKSIEKKPRAILRKENSLIKEIDSLKKSNEKLKRIIDDIINQDYDTIIISGKHYTVNKEYDEHGPIIVFSHKKHGVEAHKKKWQKKPEKTRVDVKEIIEEHKMLRRIGNENHKR
ncbi:MAG: DUF460 domain-containing protein [Candidatus Woesearchaeota archaeon]